MKHIVLGLGLLGLVMPSVAWAGPPPILDAAVAPDAALDVDLGIELDASTIDAGVIADAALPPPDMFVAEDAALPGFDASPYTTEPSGGGCNCSIASSGSTPSLSALLAGAVMLTLVRIRAKRTTTRR